MKVTLEIDIDSVVELLTKLREAESAYSEQLDLVQEVLWGYNSSLAQTVQRVSRRTYQALELLGFDGDTLYDWVQESEEYLLFCGGFIYDVTEPIDFAKYNLTTMKCPVGEYVEENGKLIKTMYWE